MTQTRIVSSYPEGERVLDTFLALIGEHFRHSGKPLMVKLELAPNEEKPDDKRSEG